MQVPVLKHADFLIASIQAALTDADLLKLRNDLAEKAGKFRTRGVVIDVTLLDVMDSFAARTMNGIVESLRLRGAETVIVGIQPEVAISMVQLGLTFEHVETALDLDEGLDLLQRRIRPRGPDGE